MPTERSTPPRKRPYLRARAAASCLCLLAALGCGGGDLVLPTDTGPTSVDASAGTGQTGTVGKPLADPIAVKVTDRQGQAVAAVRVAFATDGAAGSSVSPDTVLTDAAGLATAQWVLGSTAGSQTATATVVGLSLSEGFTATATSGAAKTIAIVTGDNQNAPAGTGLPEPLVVLVTDQFGNPVQGVEVSWTATTGTVDPASVTTGAKGQAATQRVLGPTAGSQEATANANGLDGSPVTFTHVATAGSASSLRLVSGNNQNAAAGAALAQPLVVRLTDGDGNPIAGSPVSWVVGTGGGSIAPSGDTDVDGKASAVFTLGPAAGANTVNAVVSGVGVVTFTATAGGGGGGGPGPSDVNSTVSASPSSIQAGSGTATITVTVLDESGVAVAGASVRLSASGSGNTLTQPAGGTAADGTTTGTLSSRVPGSKVIRATINDNIQVAQTAEVVVTIAPATTLTLVAGDGQTADAGSAVRVRPQVRVTDELRLPSSPVSARTRSPTGYGEGRPVSRPPPESPAQFQVPPARRLTIGDDRPVMIATRLPDFRHNLSPVPSRSGTL